MTEIRAAVCTAFNAPLSIETLRLAAPGPGEVEVRLAATAICHSDISYAEGAWGGPLPAVYGHEAAGHVARLGPGVSRFQDGQRVLVTLVRSCGHCPCCAAAQPAYCESPAPLAPLTRPDGTPVAQGLACGAFAERVVVHESQLAPLPDAIALDVAALLGCGVLTGVGAAVHAAALRPGETAVVIGAGGVGLNAIQGARIAGAAQIIAIDMSEGKLATARDFGATAGVLASDPKPWTAVRALTGGRGADAVIVTTGALPAYAVAPRLLAPRGRLVMVGMPPSGAKVPFEPVILAALGQRLIGSKMGDTVLSRDVPWLCNLYAQGRLLLDPLISAHYPLERINEAIAHANTGTARRNVITF